MDKYSGLLERIVKEVPLMWPPSDEQEEGDEWNDKKPDPRRPIFRLDDIDSSPHLRDVLCWAVDDFATDCEEMRDIRVVFYRFHDPKNPSDILERVVIEFFDALYSEISKRGGNELTAFVFGKDWLALLLPKAVASNSEFSNCWKVLRDGFRTEDERVQE